MATVVEATKIKPGSFIYIWEQEFAEVFDLDYPGSSKSKDDVIPIIESVAITTAPIKEKPSGELTITGWRADGATLIDPNPEQLIEWAKEALETMLYGKLETWKVQSYALLEIAVEDDPKLIREYKKLIIKGMS